MFCTTITMHSYRSGTVMPYGWTIVEVNYAVEVNDDGELTGIYALGATSDADEVEDKAKTKAKGKDTPYQKFTVPVRRTRTSGAYPYLFCDAAHYMFGTPKRDSKGKVSTIDYYGAMKNAVWDCVSIWVNLRLFVPSTSSMVKLGTTPKQKKTPTSLQATSPMAVSACSSIMASPFSKTMCSRKTTRS